MDSIIHKFDEMVVHFDLVIDAGVGEQPDADTCRAQKSKKTQRENSKIWSVDPSGLNPNRTACSRQHNSTVTL